MQTQFSLPGFDPGPTEPPAKQNRIGAKRDGPPTHKLFLALFPSPEDAARIAQIADSLRDEFGLADTHLRNDRLHVTLHSLGDFVGAVPEPLMEQASAVASAVTGPPVHVVFDHAVSFRGNGAFVLSGQDNGAVDDLRGRLGTALEHSGLRHQPSNTPHMTLLYDRKREVTKYAIQPIRWTTKEFVLVLSHLGQKRHQWLVRSPLTEGA